MPNQLSLLRKARLTPYTVLYKKLGFRKNAMVYGIALRELGIYKHIGLYSFLCKVMED